MKYEKKPAENINIANVTKELIGAVMKMNGDDKFGLLNKIMKNQPKFSTFYNSRTITREVIEMIMKMSLEEKCKLLGELKATGGGSRRQYTREDYVTPVHFAVKGILLNGYTKNISKGGVFIETTKASELKFAPGDPVTMNFTHPKFRHPVKITGKIARVSKVGIGVEFDESL
jgi:hypothetical protein